MEELKTRVFNTYKEYYEILKQVKFESYMKKEKGIIN